MNNLKNKSNPENALATNLCFYQTGIVRLKLAKTHSHYYSIRFLDAYDWIESYISRSLLNFTNFYFKIVIFYLYTYILLEYILLARWNIVASKSSTFVLTTECNFSRTWLYIKQRGKCVAPNGYFLIRTDVSPQTWIVGAVTAGLQQESYSNALKDAFPLACVENCGLRLRYFTPVKFKLKRRRKQPWI